MTVSINGDTGVSAVQSGAIQVSDIPDNTITTAKLTTQVQGALGVRNLIINGDMRIAQRGTSVTGITGNGYYTVDRFDVSITTGGTWTQTQSTDVPSGQGFTSSLKMDCTTANASLGASSVVIMHQAIEAQNLQHLKFGTSSAESLTLSFWVKSNKTGTYTAEFFLQDDARQNSQTFTIDTADTWEKKTITIDGDTVGVIENDNGTGMTLFIWLASGSTWTSGTLNTAWASSTNANRVSSSNVNLADSTSNYINITGVQLEVGDTATPFEHRPYDMELARCQRYYYRVNYGHPDSTIGVGAMYTASLAYFAIPFPVTMRVKPSIEVENETGFRVFAGNGVSTPSTVTAWSQGSITNGMVRVDGLSRTQGQACFMDTNQSTSTLSWSAEL